MRAFKMTFIGAGSTIFAKNVVGDCILRFLDVPFEVALYDIDPVRLDESHVMLSYIVKKYGAKARIRSYTDRLEALRGADFVVNAIQVGGYESTLVDFEVPKKYGFRQTIADTMGIGGIFRAMRTVPVLESIGEDMHKVCPDALFLNYVNPMSVLTKYLIQNIGIRAVGLCHSVQHCVKGLLEPLDMAEYEGKCSWNIAGVNHQAWLLDIHDDRGNDLYPEIKKRSKENFDKHKFDWDLVRHEMMHRFGYYITESSEHSAEYYAYFIKDRHPELIDRYRIPLDEYPRRCVKQQEEWEERKKLLVGDTVEHEPSVEFASLIIGGVLGNTPCRIHGNVINEGLITNLPAGACVEVPCLVDEAGLHPCYVGKLPEQLAALNRVTVGEQNMTVEAIADRSKDEVYMAAYLNPRLAAELTLDEIRNMCDDLFEAHKQYLHDYK